MAQWKAPDGPPEPSTCQFPSDERPLQATLSPALDRATLLRGPCPRVLLTEGGSSVLYKDSRKTPDNYVKTETKGGRRKG